MHKRWLLLLCCALLFAGCDAGYGPDETHPVYRKALNRRSVGKYKEAETLLKRFLKSRPKSARGCLALAQLYDENLNDPLSAVYYYREFLKLDPDSTESRDVRKLMQRCEERLQSAPRQQKQAQKLADENIRLKKALLQSDKNLVKLRTRLDESEKRAADAEKQAKAEHDARIAEEKTVPQTAPAPLPEKPAPAIPESAAVPEKPAVAAAQQSVPETEKTSDGEKPIPSAVPSPAVADSGTAAEKPAAAPAPAPKKPQSRLDSLSFAFPAAGLSSVRLRRVTKEDPPAMSGAAAAKSAPDTPKADGSREWPKIHVVKPGDSLSAISRKYYGTTQYYTRIMEVNQIKNARGLSIGQKLILPAPEKETKK